MGSVVKCPRCGLINPNTGQRCDCGYDFRINEVDPRFAKPVAKAEGYKRLAVRAVAVALILFILCLLPSSAHAYLTFSKILLGLGLAVILAVAGYVLFRATRKSS